MSLSLKTLSDVERFLLSDRVTLRGSEVIAFGNMVGEIRQERDRLANAEKVAARVRPVVVQQEG